MAPQAYASEAAPAGRVAGAAPRPGGRGALGGFPRGVPSGTTDARRDADLAGGLMLVDGLPCLAGCGGGGGGRER